MRKALSIAHVAPRYAPEMGGVETHVREVATRLADLGHGVHVFTQTRDRRAVGTEWSDGVLVSRYWSLPSSTHFLFAPALPLGLWRRLGDFDIVHAHNYHALPMLVAGCLNPEALVVTPHFHGVTSSTLRSMLHVPYRRLGRVPLTRAARVICVSEVEKAALVTTFPGIRTRTVVIPNGVSRDDIANTEPFMKENIVVVAAGRLEAYKRVERLLEAVPHLGSEIRLHVVGTGSKMMELQGRARSLRIASRVSFHGRMDTPTVYKWLRTADVYVSLSEIEAFGLGAAEALVAGSPAVLSDIPAHRELAQLVGRGVALVSHQAPPTDIAAAIRSSIGHTPDSSRILAWDDVATRVGTLYRDVLQ